MKETCIHIKFPDRFTEEEVLNAVMEELDTKTYKQLGIRFYRV